MFAHDTTYEQALSFSRFDSNHFLSPRSAHGFTLEDHYWPTAEHYYQASKYPLGEYRQRIMAATAEEAYVLGNTWWRRKRGDFKAERKTLMTRALYSKAIQNPAIATELLATGEQLIIESSAYQHYWGIGRDQRGENHLGKIWMDVRSKLKTRSVQASLDLPLKDLPHG